MHQLAKATGWGYNEIMDEVPLALGLQIIDAECLRKGIMRERMSFLEDYETADDIIDNAFKGIGNGS